MLLKVNTFSLLGAEFQNFFVLEARVTQLSLGVVQSLSTFARYFLLPLNLLLLPLMTAIARVGESTSQASYDGLEDLARF